MPGWVERSMSFQPWLPKSRVTVQFSLRFSYWLSLWPSPTCNKAKTGQDPLMPKAACQMLPLTQWCVPWAGQLEWLHWALRCLSGLKKTRPADVISSINEDHSLAGKALLLRPCWRDPGAGEEVKEGRKCQLPWAVLGMAGLMWS